MTEQPIVNPYYILNVSPESSKLEIIQALAEAMKQKRYPVRVLSEAQKSLLNSQKRLVADFLLPIIPPLKRFKFSDFSKLDDPIPMLKFLTVFDTLNQDLAREIAIAAVEHLPLEIPDNLVRGEDNVGF